MPPLCAAAAMPMLLTADDVASEADEEKIAATMALPTDWKTPMSRFRLLPTPPTIVLPTVPSPLVIEDPTVMNVLVKPSKASEKNPLSATAAAPCALSAAAPSAVSKRLEA